MKRLKAWIFGKDSEDLRAVVCLISLVSVILGIYVLYVYELNNIFDLMVIIGCIAFTIVNVAIFFTLIDLIYQYDRH